MFNRLENREKTYKNLKVWKKTEKKTQKNISAADTQTHRHTHYTHIQRTTSNNKTIKTRSMYMTNIIAYIRIFK